MTPRQLREQIEAIDRRLKELGPWEKKLVAARQRWLLENTDDARWAVAIIEDGLRPGGGRPSDPDLAPLDRGMPGLHATRETIVELKERRALLVEQLPSRAEAEAKATEADALAANIRARAEALAARIPSLQAAVADTARLALDIAQEAHRLWDDNLSLDRLVADADITRPETQRADVPVILAAAPLGMLLGRHFRAGQPYAVDPHVTRQIRNALREPEPELTTT